MVTRYASPTSTPGAASPAEPGVEAPLLAHQPSLDGLRGLAVAAVVCFHGGLGWAVGGYLGVSTFFTLSGFLITTLLLAEHQRTGTISLRRFWVRRARRLLPASLLTLAAVVALTPYLGDSGQLHDLRADALAALLDVANWRFVLADTAYADLFTAPSPVLHFWSLAIEEQFYLALPLVAVAVLRTAGRRGFGALLAACAVASTWWLSHRAGTAGLDAAYYDSAARAAELLAGCLLAVVAGRRLMGQGPAMSATMRWLLAGGGLVGLTGSAAAWVTVERTTEWLTTGGLAGYALLSTALVGGATVPGPVRRALSAAPLVALGKLSYGLYLFHWPVFLWLDAERAGVDGTALFAVRAAVSVGLAAASYHLIEAPIRWNRRPRARRLTWAMPIAVGSVAVGALLVPLAVDAPDDTREMLAALEGPQEPAPSPALAWDATPVDAATAAPPEPSPPVAREERAIERVLLLGDSVGAQATPAFQKHFGAAGIEVGYAGGPASGPLFPQGGWAAQLEHWLAVFEPDAVLIEACCDYTYPHDPLYVDIDGVEVQPNSERMFVAWEREVRALIDRIETAGAEPYLVRFPPAAANSWYGPMDSHVERLNAIVDVMGVEVVDWASLLAPDGLYTDALPDGRGGAVRVRLEDGVHLTEAGSELVAAHSLEALLG